MMKRMTSWFCDVCGCRSDILEEECPNGCQITPIEIYLIEKKPWCSGVPANTDMVRVTLDMTKIDWWRLQKHVEQMGTNKDHQ